MSEPFSSITDWPAWENSARAALNGRTRVEEVEGHPMVYNDTETTGHLYWWVNGLVACCPVFADGILDLDNIACAGAQDGAEPDLYGRECLIAAKLAQRFGNPESIRGFQELSESYFDQAKQENCYAWGPEEIPPV
jgi:hypothetical protein